MFSITYEMLKVWTNFLLVLMVRLFLLNILFKLIPLNTESNRSKEVECIHFSKKDKIKHLYCFKILSPEEDTVSISAWIREDHEAPSSEEEGLTADVC